LLLELNCRNKRHSQTLRAARLLHLQVGTRAAHGGDNCCRKKRARGRSGDDALVQSDCVLQEGLRFGHVELGTRHAGLTVDGGIDKAWATLAAA